ncbi:Hypothetical_protein [Hexamita inflata]|uniref:Hypothetical_protein n=1 Tax=Hexamita inflata TaxID=28002 RepID=A0AA86QLM8_9EUKA|nr:Hypothetical protein HINF_LOCUS41665 [Hexamita inflata]CAI9976683.1 Hypothetical protein HINF_LOCUS64328 [Hexamita inflata]
MAEINESEILARCIPFKSYNNYVFKNYKIDPITLKLYKNNKALPLKTVSYRSSAFYFAHDLDLKRIEIYTSQLQKGCYNNCENYLEKVEEYNQYAEIIKTKFGMYAHGQQPMIPE